MMIKVAVILALLGLSLSTNFFNLAKMPTANGARCMDGTQYGIYWA